MRSEPSVLPSAERWARVVATVSAATCALWLALFTWWMSAPTTLNKVASGSWLIAFGVFISAGAIVCLDLRRRALGTTTRRWFGGMWNQLLLWNLWNLLWIAPIGRGTWLGRVGLAVSIGLLALSLLGKDLQGRVSAGPSNLADVD